jgi:hypothetical protein
MLRRGISILGAGLVLTLILEGSGGFGTQCHTGQVVTTAKVLKALRS